MTEDLKEFLDTFYVANINDRKLKKPIKLEVKTASQVFSMVNALKEYKEHLGLIKDSLSKAHSISLTDVTPEFYKLITKESKEIQNFLDKSTKYIEEMEGKISKNLNNEIKEK